MMLRTQLWELPFLDTMSVVKGTFAFVAVIFTAIYLYAIRNFGYWRRKNINYIKPIAFAGNLKDVVLFRKNIGSLLQDEYNKSKGQRYIGMYFFDKPVLLVRDISLWKNFMHKDFEHFTDRAFCSRKSDIMYHYALFAQKGKIWKNLRAKLTRAFTSAKLRKFFVLLEEKALHLDTYFDDAVRDGKSRNIADVCGRYTTDVVATVGFGIATSALTNEDDTLRHVLKDVFVFSKTHLLLILAAFVDMHVLKILRPTFSHSPLVSFVRRAVWSVIDERERTGTTGKRGDFLDILMELREKGNAAANNTPTDGTLSDGDSQKNSGDGIAKGKYSHPRNGEVSVDASNSNESLVTSSAISSNPVEMDDEAVTSQALNFFSGGYDTSSTTMSFALYELALNQHIQEKLRISLMSAVDEHGGKLTYDAVQSCTYLDMVFSETLRMYPVLPFLDRVCTKTYALPESDLVIEKGTVVMSSILGIQRDPDYFSDPNRFDPERFSEQNKASIISGSLFPFGDGPRICIGMRLGLLQSKLGLAHIILNYRLHPCAETPHTMEFNVHSFLIQPKNGVPVKFTRV